MRLWEATTKQFCNLYEQDRVYSKYIKRYTKSISPWCYTEKKRHKHLCLVSCQVKRVKKQNEKWKISQEKEEKNAGRNLMTHFVHGNGFGKQYTAKAQIVSTCPILKAKFFCFLIITYSIVLYARKENSSMPKDFFSASHTLEIWS